MKSFTLFELLLAITIISFISIFTLSFSANILNLHFQTKEKTLIDSKLSNAILQVSKLFELRVFDSEDFTNGVLSWFAKSNELNLIWNGKELSPVIYEITEVNKSQSNKIEIFGNISLAKEVVSSITESEKFSIFFGNEKYSGEFIEQNNSNFFQLESNKSFKKVYEKFELSFIKYSIFLENGNLLLSINLNKSILLENVSKFNFNKKNEIEICIKEFCQTR
jgi:hypothetical protein